MPLYNSKSSLRVSADTFFSRCAETQVSTLRQSEFSMRITGMLQNTAKRLVLGVRNNVLANSSEITI